jgi:hypothetical protein
VRILAVAVRFCEGESFSNVYGEERERKYKMKYLVKVKKSKTNRPLGCLSTKRGDVVFLDF